MPQDAFDSLADRPVFRHFAELVRTPRPSKGEAEVQDKLARWAESQGYQTTRDAADNLCVHVPASLGCETAPTVIIQNHTDIVVSNATDAPAGVDSAGGKIPVERGDVRKDGTFTPSETGGWLRAPYTTLGADNGIGCAMGMALCDDPDAVRPPLELLFTVDEEQGLTGALNLDAAALGLRGRTLINLDTEDDDELTIGCAGGMDTEILWTAAREPVPADHVALAVSVGPTRGGHSGIEIDKGRANAIRILARLLRHAAETAELRIASIGGGDKRNAIPREARAVVTVPADETDIVRVAVRQLRGRVSGQFEGRDVDLAHAVADPAECDRPETGFGVEPSRRLIDMLLAFPAGVLAMTPEITGLVETSNNLAVVTTDGSTEDAAHGSTVRIVCNSRSSSAAAKKDVAATLRAVAELGGATTKTTNEYPGWQPDVNSELLALTRAAYKRLFGEEPRVHAIHAGLECGVLAERIGGEVDSISFGPNIRGNHAPGEHVEIASVEKSYQLLKAVLAELAQK